MGQQNTKRLSKEDITHLKNNTNFTEREIKEWFKGFMKDCPSGELTKDKFLGVYKSFFPKGDAHQFCSHVFRTFDANNNGSIDFKEFMLAIYITSSGTPHQKLTWAFHMYDIDGDGFVKKEEMVEIITAIYSMIGPSLMDTTEMTTAEKRTDEIFKQMDDNKDGLLSREEFITSCLKDETLYDLLTSEFQIT